MFTERETKLKLNIENKRLITPKTPNDSTLNFCTFQAPLSSSSCCGREGLGWFEMLFWFRNGFREVKGCGKGCGRCMEVGNGGWNGGKATAEKGSGWNGWEATDWREKMEGWLRQRVFVAVRWKESIQSHPRVRLSGGIYRVSENKTLAYFGYLKLSQRLLELGN